MAGYGPIFSDEVQVANLVEVRKGFVQVFRFKKGAFTDKKNYYDSGSVVEAEVEWNNIKTGVLPI